MAYKHDYDKILTRLVNTLSKLNNGEALSTTELAKEYNVSERTIRRDFNEHLINFPIYKDGKKWKMKEGFRLEKIASLEDTVVLNIIEGLVEGSSGKFSQKAKKLLAKIKNEEYNPIYTKLNLEDISDKLTEVQKLESAIKGKNIIKCSYAFEGYSKKIELKPLKIVNYEGFWYLVALDARDDTLKKYYLKNVTNIQILQDLFIVENALDELLENSISVWFERKNKPFEVKLRIDAKIEKYFRRKPISKTQKIVASHEDGSVEISISITHDMEIIPLIKYWIPHIKVIEPKRIQDEIERDLRKYLRL